MIKTMTRQEILNKMVAGMDSQGWVKSCLQGNENLCAYRDSEGRKCAVGHLIPDEVYDADMDIIFNGIEELNEEYCLFNNEDIFFLEEYQTAHDNTDSPEEREMEFRELAKTYNLTWPKGDGSE